MPRALVTGGTGFVGGALIRHLRETGWSVAATRRADGDGSAADGVAWYGLTGSDVRSVVDRAAPDAVFHLAAHQARSRTPADVEAFLDANIALGVRLHDAVVGRRTAAGSDVVIVSAMSFFQFRDGAPSIHSLYASSKQAYAVLADYYRQAEGVDSRQVVLYDNYGPADPRPKLVPQLLQAARAAAPVTVGPLEQPLNLLHVDDVAAGLIAAAAPGEASVTTVRAAATTTVGDVVAAVAKAAGHPLDIEVDETRRVSDLPLVAGEWPTPRAWEPAWTLESGLRQAYEDMPR
jgi:nucleoside-diphosphate-sugar epimerase